MLTPFTLLASNSLIQRSNSCNWLFNIKYDQTFIVEIQDKIDCSLLFDFIQSENRNSSHRVSAMCNAFYTNELHGLIAKLITFFHDLIIETICKLKVNDQSVSLL